MNTSATRTEPAIERESQAGLHGLLRDERGTTAVEYAFILVLVVLAMIGALSEVGNDTTSMWNNVNSKVTAAH